MNTPTVDIIVPVWNYPFETRACLAAILTNSPDARLIIVDNNSSRETELMLEEFSEPLGERGLFIKSQRNVGLVPAINLGLARSDSDFAVIVRPQVLVGSGWLDTLIEAAGSAGAGVVSPLFNGEGAPQLPRLTPGCTVMESCIVSFSALLLRGETRIMTGMFNEQLDGGDWCLREYVRRAAEKGYRTCITARTVLQCGAEPFFGTAERRAEIVQNSAAAYLEQWGAPRHYCVYFGREAQAGDLSEIVDAIVAGARTGDRYTLLLHHRQHRDFCRLGWNGLHTGIDLIGVSFLFPQRTLAKRIERIFSSDTDCIAVRGTEGALFPGRDEAIPIVGLFEGLRSCHAAMEMVQ